MRFTRTHSQSAWVVAVSLVAALASVLIAAPALATAVPGIHAEQFSYDDVPLTYGSAVGVALNQDAEPRVSMVPVTRSEGSVERTSDAVAHVVDSSVDLVAPNGPPGGAKPFLDDHGRLTNGTYTIDTPAMAKHKTGDLSSGNSQFGFGVDAETLTLDAASLADANDLWVAANNSAKVPVTNGIVGALGRTGEPTSWINVYRTNTGFVHGSPAGPP